MKRPSSRAQDVWCACPPGPEHEGSQPKHGRLPNEPGRHIRPEGSAASATRTTRRQRPKVEAGSAQQAQAVGPDPKGGDAATRNRARAATIGTPRATGWSTQHPTGRSTVGGGSERVRIPRPRLPCCPPRAVPDAVRTSPEVNCGKARVAFPARHATRRSVAPTNSGVRSQNRTYARDDAGIWRQSDSAHERGQ